MPETRRWTCSDGAMSARFGSKRDEAAKLSRRSAALDVLDLGDLDARGGDNEFRERVDQLAREGIRVQRCECPHIDVGARGGLAHLILERLPSSAERRTEQVQMD